MNRPAALLCLVTTAIASACSGFSEAMTAHVEVAARAGSQELSVDRLASLLAHAKAPPQKDFASQLADFWVDYQLLGRAAAHGDSLNTKKDEDVALWAVIGSARARKYFEVLAKTWVGADSSSYAAKYAAGDVLSARHILLMPPRGDTAKAALDSVRRKAEALRLKVTKTNFAQLASENSQDPGSARNGGDLRVFQKGQMVPEFEKALLTTKPGEVTPGIVKTQFGYHIIYRPTYDEVKGQVAQVAGGRAKQAAESTFFAHLDSTAKIQVKPGAAAASKAVASNVDAHKADKAVIATSTSGDFTAADLARWLALFPAAQRTQLATTVPDSQIPVIIKNFVRNELVMKQADSAKVTLDSLQMADIVKGYDGLIANAWNSLGVDPKTLADSAKAVSQRERIAGAHVDAYLERLIAGAPGTRFVDVPTPIEQLLRTKYSDFVINQAGIDRALARATSLRKTSDSVKSASEPPSAVPLPGMTPAVPPAPGAGGQTPPPGAKH